MSVLINFKICDNAEECGGLAVCPTGALSWNKKKKSIIIDNKKCISCHKCEVCPVSAIAVAENEKEYRKIKKEIDDDPRKLTDLYIDRYGAQPIHTAFLLPKGKFQFDVLGSDKIVAAEFFNGDSIMCLLKSIPMKELLTENIKYRKVRAEDDLLKDYKIKKLPALLFFQRGKLIGKIEGYYDIKKKEVLAQKIKSIIEKNKN